jgi:uncharacterized protein YidB (DUF937 family)
MGLFDAILSSMNDPSRATQRTDLEGLLGAFGGGGGGGASSSPNVGQMAGPIGGLLKPMLQEQQAVSGPQGVDSLLQEIKQSANSPDQLRQVLGPDRMDQMVDRAQQRTGLDTNTVLRLVSIALPAVIALLQSGRPAAAAPVGAAVTGPTRPTAGAPTNPILSQFLDSDGDGDVDMTDMLQLTSRFLQK